MNDREREMIARADHRRNQIRNAQFDPAIGVSEMTENEVRRMYELVQALLAYEDEIDLCERPVTSKFVKETFANLDEFGKYLVKRLTKLDAEKLRKWFDTASAPR